MSMYKSFLIPVLIVFTSIAVSCKKDKADTTKPEVSVTAPVSGTVYAVGETIRLTADLSDNKELKSCKVTIAYSGDGSGEGNPWAPSATTIALSGTSQSVDQDLFGGPIPTCKSGDYKITIEVSDAADVPNVTTKEIDVQIYPDAPQLTVDVPQENQEYVAGVDFMVLTATCTDNKGLKSLVYDVVYTDAGKNVLKGATGVNDPWEPGERTISLSGTSKSFSEEPLFDGQIPESLAGNYKLILRLYDTDNNVTTKEIKFILNN